MPRAVTILAALAFSLAVPRAAPADPAPDNPPRYVIVTDAGEDADRDPWFEVVEALADLRAPVAVLRLNPGGLEEVLADLSDLEPEFVAFVVRPEVIEDNFVGRAFEGLTRLDEDPLLDCAHGYVTGLTAEDALGLVRRTAAAEAKPEDVPRKFAAVAHTFRENDLGPFAGEQGTYFAAFGYETVGVNPIDPPLAGAEGWLLRRDEEIHKLDGASLVFFAGHGMGTHACTIPGAMLGGVRLESAVVVNGTCHSAVTQRRYDVCDRFGSIEERGIHPPRSVALNLVSAGAIGQLGSTASSCWMNVAPAIPRFFHEGRSLGAALMDHLNERIASTGIDRVEVVPFRDGEVSPHLLGPDRNPAGLQSLARVVLIGDPAYRPFPEPPRRLIRPEAHRH